MHSVKQAFKAAPVTFILAAANIIIFLGLSFIGMTEDGNFMAQHGAMYVPYVIAYKEYYRLITCIFLHFGIGHLVNNMISLVLFGSALEKEIGSIKFAIIYFISGIGANIVSAIYDYSTQRYAVSAGASGAIFGAIGALLYVAIRNRGHIGNISSRGIVIMIAFTLYYGLTSQGVDNLAHVGGLVIGIILGILLYWKKKNKYKNPYYDRWH
ncbi:MAG: rhomboid family intramembrane serine protease [Suipraeoptans sp.]